MELTFDLSSYTLPVSATNVYLNIIYKNTSTSKTVAVGFRDISEPTPVDVYNNTDYTCLNNTWYRYNDQDAMTIVDSNKDGIADLSDIYPHTISNISFLAGPAGGEGALDASVSSTLFASGPLPTGQSLRMGYILTDYTNSYAFNETRTGQNGDLFPHPAKNSISYSGKGFRNDSIMQSDMFGFRGIKLWGSGGVIFINQMYNSDSSNCTFDKLNQKLGL